MNTSQIYILLSIVTLAIILAIVAIIRRKKPKAKLSKLAGISFALIIAGIAFGENRLIGYSLMGTGVLIAVIDIIRKR